MDDEEDRINDNHLDENANNRDDEAAASSVQSICEEDFNLEGEFHEDGLETSGDLAGSRRVSMIEVRQDEAEEDEENDRELEFDYEPGISLSNLEFGQASEEPCWPESCLFCGVDYETGKAQLAHSNVKQCAAFSLNWPSFWNPKLMLSIKFGS